MFLRLAVSPSPLVVLGEFFSPFPGFLLGHRFNPSLEVLFNHQFANAVRRKHTRFSYPGTLSLTFENPVRSPQHLEPRSGWIPAPPPLISSFQSSKDWSISPPPPCYTVLRLPASLHRAGCKPLRWKGVYSTLVSLSAPFPLPVCAPNIFNPMLLSGVIFVSGPSWVPFLKSRPFGGYPSGR